MANINKKNKPQRVDSDFVKEMKDIAKVRFIKGLSKDLPNMPKMTRLVRRTHFWKNCLFELKTKKEKEELI